MAKAKLKVKTLRNLFDRFTAMQNHGEYTIEGNVSGEWLDVGIMVEPQFITTEGFKSLQQEFRHAFMSDGKIVLED